MWNLFSYNPFENQFTLDGCLLAQGGDDVGEKEDFVCLSVVDDKMGKVLSLELQIGVG